MLIKKAVLAGLLLSAAAPAFAVVSPFGGASSGTDPLGHSWSASGTHWGEPGYLQGTLTFNPNNTTDLGDYLYATSFSFTFLKGVNGTIDQTPSFTPFGSGPETRFSNLATGVAWLVSFSPDGDQVTFTAPTMDDKLNPGDSFFVNVAFTGNIDTSRFSFAGLWDEEPVGSVPEPASWAMMVGGFGLLGAAMRRRPRTSITFA